MLWGGGGSRGGGPGGGGYNTITKTDTLIQAWGGGIGYRMMYTVGAMLRSLL